MARRMDFDEYVSFEVSFMEEEAKATGTWETEPVEHKRDSNKQLPPGVYFVVDSSCIMVVSGHVCKTTH